MTAAGISAFNVQIMSVRQMLIPEEMFGRVQGAYRTVIWGGIRWARWSVARSDRG